MYKVYKLFNNDLEYYGITKLSSSHNLSLLKACTDNETVKQIFQSIEYEYLILETFKTRDEAKQYKLNMLGKQQLSDEEKKLIYKDNYKTHINTFKTYYQENKDKIKEYNRNRYNEKKQKIKELEQKLKELEKNNIN